MVQIPGRVTLLNCCVTCCTGKKNRIATCGKIEPLGVVMIRLGVIDLKPGMILEQAVKNHQGVLLLEAGARITKKNVRIFKSWGVTEVFVKGDMTRVTDSDGTPDPLINESDEIQLKEKFADVLDDPVMVEIFNAARRQLNKDPKNNESKDEHAEPSKINRKNR